MCLILIFPVASLPFIKNSFFNFLLRSARAHATRGPELQICFVLSSAFLSAFNNRAAGIKFFLTFMVKVKFP